MGDFKDIFEKTKSSWDQLLKDESNSNLRIRDAAFKLNISEAELLSTKSGELVKFLKVDDTIDLFKKILRFDKLMFLSRNDYVVHEKTLFCKDVELVDRNLISKTHLFLLEQIVLNKLLLASHFLRCLLSSD